MNTVIEIQLEWKYTPENYFEEPISIEEYGFELSIADGVALAKIDPIYFEKHPETKTHITDLIESRFHAVQIMTHKNYNLRKPSRSDLRKNGGKNIFLEVESGIIAVSSLSADIVIKDKNGKVISDTRQERLDKQNWFSETVLKYRNIDSCLDRMLNSYQVAVRDQKNELVHLYEIRDALSVKFRNKKNTVKKIGISSKEWDIIGKLANHLPLEEGRHRGKSAGSLRPAGKVELETARRIISGFVEKYLLYLDNK